MFGLGLIGTLIYFFTLVDVIRCEFRDSKNKLIWIVIVVLLPLIGTLLWFFVGRKKRL
ncbi:PLDc N-terminal domain-containing protein [Pararhodonellum marinum]|uniref:PLDc N-terminal domain-containing protein n=1 Tax=Pararhodonellum marinum TaxID=2755358 RepID=UPI00189006F2|nr:PLDc N-terminal domain-containing protein [Pararhodonellum marinum]